MNLRRLTASLLAAVSLLALTACGAPADSAPAQEDTQQSAAAESQTAPEGGEFRVGMGVPTPQQLAGKRRERHQLPR